MFDVNRYMPILRWKRAEKIALRHLQPADRALMTPLIELVPTNFKPGRQGSEADPATVLEREAKEIAKDWGTTPFLIDFEHVEECIASIRGFAHPLECLSDHATKQGLRLVPVTGLSRGNAYQSAVRRIASNGTGTCFRFSWQETLRPEFRDSLPDLAKRLRTGHEAVDLVLDYKVFDQSAPPLNVTISRIPHVDSWRTVTFACGAFPPDLQEFTPGRHTIDRADWLTYRNQIRSPRRLPRAPAFSDYTVQYGLYKEPPAHSNPSASIRYALDEKWVIMRGEGIFNEDGPGREQYIANATLLCESDDFYGSNFSYGDSYTYDVSQGVEGHGSPETWIRAGINHHMTVTCRQVAGFCDSLDNDAPRRASGRILHAPAARNISTRGA